MMTTLRMGTRGSQLAIAQAESVARKLAERNPGIAIETVIITTSGDINKTAPLYAMKTPGTFTREIEKALFEHRIDFAVHSLKDLPAFLPEGLSLAPPPPAEDARECIIGAIHEGCIIGCGSPRRRFALSLLMQNCDADVCSDVQDMCRGAQGMCRGTQAERRDTQGMCRDTQAERRDAQAPLAFADIRGNIPTRLEKLRSGHYGAIVMAYAAIKRLGLENLGLRPEDARVLDAEDMLPAPCQGILGLEYRADDEAVQEILSSISDEDAILRAQAERAFLQTLHLGCNTPASCLAQRQGLLVVVRASLAAVPATDEANCVRCAETDAAQAGSAESAAHSNIAFAEACIVNAAQAGSAAPNAAIMLETEFAMPSELAEEAGKLAAQTLMSGCQAHSLMPAPEPPRQTIPMQKICLKPCRPLAGKTAVILRSPDEAEPFIKALETLGAKALAYPVIRCEPLSKQEIPQDLLAEFAEKPQSFQAIVFASRRSPELTLKALGDKARKLPVFCTGDSTAASALKCGYPKERIIVPHRHDATGIIEAMRSHFGMNACPCASEERTSKPDELSAALGTSAPQKPAATAPRIIITMPQGTDHLAQAAEKAGFQVARLPLYRTVPLKEAPALAPAPPALATATSVQASQPPTLTSVVPDLIMAFSPSALESFFRLSNISPQSAHIAAIGKSTAAAAEKLGCTDIAISPLPEPQHFLKTVFQYLTSYK